jgi:regulation of enolase protein 1 (concanavalin A-like superfamily)
MNVLRRILLAVSVSLTAFTVLIHAEELLFQDDFKSGLGPGWTWIRENRQAWRTSEYGLEVKIEPGNMWGPQNDAHNVLVRPVPIIPTNSMLSISVLITNNPSSQYEQTDLVWYYNDSNMIKIGQEMVDGKLSVVMGREQNDKTRTIAIIPLYSTFVRLRLLASGNTIRGQFRTPANQDWREAGSCDMPVPPGTSPRISLQFYQGVTNIEHWSRVTEFRVTSLAQ